MAVSDAEKAFYESVIASPQGKTLNDLRYAYFLAALGGALPAPSNIPWGNITGSSAGVTSAVKNKAQIAALTPLADPEAATTAQVATLLNAVIAALKA